jgi:hypothetical protein
MDKNNFKKPDTRTQLTLNPVVIFLAILVPLCAMRLVFQDASDLGPFHTFTAVVTHVEHDSFGYLTFDYARLDDGAWGRCQRGAYISKPMSPDSTFNQGYYMDWPITTFADDHTEHVGERVTVSGFRNDGVVDLYTYECRAHIDQTVTHQPVPGWARADVLVKTPYDMRDGIAARGDVFNDTAVEFIGPKIGLLRNGHRLTAHSFEAYCLAKASYMPQSGSPNLLVGHIVSASNNSVVLDDCWSPKRPVPTLDYTESADLAYADALESAYPEKSSAP